MFTLELSAMQKLLSIKHLTYLDVYQVEYLKKQILKNKSTKQIFLV